VEFQLGAANVSGVPFDTIFYFLPRGRRTSLISFSHNWAAAGSKEKSLFTFRDTLINPAAMASEIANAIRADADELIREQRNLMRAT
jgi:hypothetical protein